MLPYIGGKSKISKHLIIPVIPHDISTYVEPFSGQFWTFFMMDLDVYPNLSNVVYNDVNDLNTNLYRCLKYPDKLLQECKKIPVQQKGDMVTPPQCREFFNRAQSILYSPERKPIDTMNFKMAAMHALILASVYSGANPQKSKYIDLRGKYHSKFTSFMNKLSNTKWTQKLEKINFVENQDFQKCIEKWDSPTTYFYLDPPYYIVGEGNYYSNHDFTSNDHERLRDSLQKIEGKFGLSYYPFDQLKDWYPLDSYSWHEKSFFKAAMATKGKKQVPSVEILITNY